MKTYKLILTIFNFLFITNGYPFEIDCDNKILNNMMIDNYEFLLTKDKLTMRINFDAIFFEENKRKYLFPFKFFIEKYIEMKNLSRTEELFVRRYYKEIHALSSENFFRYVFDFNYRTEFGNNVIIKYFWYQNIILMKLDFNIYITQNIIPLYENRVKVDFKNLDLFFNSYNLYTEKKTGKKCFEEEYEQILLEYIKYIHKFFEDLTKKYCAPKVF